MLGNKWNVRLLVPLLIFGIGTIYYYHSGIRTLPSSPLTSIMLASKTSSLVPSTSTSTTSSSPPYKLVQMNDRVPSFTLATVNGHPPYADGDKAQATVISSLQLMKRCHSDPSLIVIDVGAFLGDFGLYAAACNCQVYMFEVQPDMVELIQTSISLNNFSTSRVHIMQMAVSDLPSDSEMVFSVQGGGTTALNGTLRASTIRLDDIKWPPQSSILMLKVDVEGFEINVLRSAENLFREKRIHHLIFEYTAWWTERAPQKELIPFVQKTLGAKKLFALGRTDSSVYGPLTAELLDTFHDDHLKRHLQTDIYATFVEKNESSSLAIQPYRSRSTFA